MKERERNKKKGNEKGRSIKNEGDIKKRKNKKKRKKW